MALAWHGNKLSISDEVDGVGELIGYIPKCKELVSGYPKSRTLNGTTKKQF
jgi:hypothetical protein